MSTRVQITIGAIIFLGITLLTQIAGVSLTSWAFAGVLAFAAVITVVFLLVVRWVIGPLGREPDGE